MTTLRHFPPTSTNIVIAGAGIMGLSIAMELHARGHSVTVIDTGLAMRAASSAAAGMLAADDPHNPAALRDLSRYSLSLYPQYLDRIARLSHEPVPFQTDNVIQHHANDSPTRIAERSIDPRQLAASLLFATQRLQLQAPSFRLIEDSGPYTVIASEEGCEIRFESGNIIKAAKVVHAQGVWFPGVKPRKGQMLRVQLPPELHTLREVHRSEDVYIVPRTTGPQTGTAIIGATIEDVGFDTSIHPHALSALRQRAAELLPVLADEHTAPTIEAWAGLRPATPDGLPLLGALSSRQLVATGHFRNGILLAPATACIVADLIESRTPHVDLRPFHPYRFRTL